jgi:DNA-binding PadR family transcriptional regulator
VSERPVSNPLALAVLACLAEGPMHPYEMAATMRSRHQDAAIKLNYGSLYSVIESLCRNGLIVAKETIRNGKRPERTIFEITAAGRHELSDWLSELLSRPVKEYTQFGAGLSLLPFVAPDEVVALLRRRLELIELELAREHSVDVHVRGKGVPRLHLIEREYEAAQRRAEAAWVKGLIAELEGGALDGMDQWHRWHAPATAEH